MGREVNVVRGQVLPFGGASGTSGAALPGSFRQGLLLRLFDQDERLGQGEASPLIGYSTDSLGECREQLDRLCQSLPLRIEDEMLTGPGAGEAMLRGLVPLPVSAPAARFALETALLDLLGKRRSASVSALLGPVAQRRLSVLLQGDEATMMRAAREAVGRGVGTVKLKIGRDFPRELAFLQRLRQELGEGIAIRLDANGSFSVADAAGRLAALSPLRPELIEEPVATAELAGWAAQCQSPVPLALDESLQRGDGLAADLLARGACQALVLKPMALGGFLRCLDLARLAARYQAGVIVTHLFDGPVGLAAAAELALALPGRVLPCGLSRHPALLAAGIAIPQLGTDAIVPTGLPGLGLLRWEPMVHREGEAAR
jgi:o-succinylbenzoate synthase